MATNPRELNGDLKRAGRRTRRSPDAHVAGRARRHYRSAADAPTATRRPRGPRCNSLRHREAQQHWKPASSRMMFPRKLVARPTLSYGLTYRRRSITSRRQGVMGLPSAALTWSRRRQLLRKTGYRKPRRIRRRSGRFGLLTLVFEVRSSRSRCDRLGVVDGRESSFLSVCPGRN
jgi:hypothetical protein